MSLHRCTHGHTFTKTSFCPVCPVCSKLELEHIYGDDFPRIGAPALRALQSAGITTLSQVLSYSDQDLLALHGFGPRALRILKERLRELGH